MKIYIMTDMEGVSGICREEQTQQGSPWYPAAQKLLCADVNAAIEGAFAGGATEVLVSDGHSSGFNLVVEEMDPRAIYERPNGGSDFLPGFDASFAGVFCVGYHAMAGTQDAFLDHTQSSASVFNYWVNGRKTGELAQVAAWAGDLGVPTLLVTGDRAACDEAREFFGDIETVAVKQGIGRQHARCVHPQKAQQLIREAAERAMKLTDEIEPYKVEKPLTIKIEYTGTKHADAVANRPGNKRLDSRTVEREVDSIREFWSF